MDGKTIDLGVNSAPTAAEQTSNVLDEDEFTSNIPTSNNKNDILPIDTNPWAESGAVSSTTITDPNDLFANIEAPKAMATSNESGDKSDDKSWANFDNMT